MERLTISRGGTERSATKAVHKSAPAARLGSAAFDASREQTGAALLEAAQAAEIDQQATVVAALVGPSYLETLALYVQAKHDQVVYIEDRLENLIDRQQARLQQTQASAPGRLSMPGSKRAWQSQQTQQQARLQTLHARLEAVREIKEGMGLHSPKLEELATRKMRAANPGLASGWDAMREAACRHELLMRMQEQKCKQSQAEKRPGRWRSLSLSAKPA